MRSLSRQTVTNHLMDGTNPNPNPNPYELSVGVSPSGGTGVKWFETNKIMSITARQYVAEAAAKFIGQQEDQLQQ